MHSLRYGSLLGLSCVLFTTGCPPPTMMPADAAPDATGDATGDAAGDAAGDTAPDAAPSALTLAPGEVVEVALPESGPAGVHLATPAGTERFVVVLGSTLLDASDAMGDYHVAQPAQAPAVTARTLDGCTITPDRWRTMMLPAETPPSGTAPAMDTERMFTIPLTGGASERITARVIYVSDHAVVWADTTAAHPATFDAGFVAQFVDAFERTTLPRERAVFGMESDIDSDGHISLLFTPLTYRTAVAYFRGCDLLPTLAGCRNANPGEVLYLTPPAAIRPPYNTLAAINETIAHELGHLIHFGHKVLRNHLVSWPDNAYLIEGTGALAQDVIGYQAGNLYVTMAGLDQIDRFSLGDILVDGAPYDATRDGLLRGDAYLFVRWLYDRGGGDAAPADGTVQNRGGPALLRALEDAPQSMTRALMTATGASLEDITMDFYAALAASNRDHAPDGGGVAPRNGCFAFLPTERDPVTMTQRGADVFATFHGMTMHGPAAQAFDMADGSLLAGGADFLVLDATAGQGEVSFDLDADRTLAPRVRIARVR